MSQPRRKWRTIRKCASSPKPKSAKAGSACSISKPNCRRQLLPKDPSDERNIFLEIRAGTGGDESALFAGDLFRMYFRYAERVGLEGRTDFAEPERTRAATRK